MCTCIIGEKVLNVTIWLNNQSKKTNFKKQVNDEAQFLFLGKLWKMWN